MRNLWDILNESILDDEEDIMNNADKMMLHPYTWLHEESLNCKNWNDLYKVLKQFYSVISNKIYSTELYPKVSAPKTGLYSRYWDLKNYRYGKNDLLCRFNFDINDPSHNITSYMNDVLYIGFAKSEGLALNIKGNKISWRIIGVDKIRDVLVARNKDKVFYINPASSLYGEYKDVANELGLK
jgi:hypothetical protein